MGTSIIFLVIILVAVGVLTGQDFIFTILYVLLGVYLLGRFWSTRSLAGISFNRKYTRRAFPTEEIPVDLQITNNTILPIVWLRVQDLLPIEISVNKSFQQIVSLAPREKMSLRYVLTPMKRGYYPVGPFKISTGDLLGLAQDERQESKSEYLTVYPRVVPLTELGLPSRSPLGTLRHHQPIFEDPTRPAGKRDYVNGDSLRRIDWKASASIGRLQVKQFEPSIALETVIFLNLNGEEYHYRKRIDATELAIVVAASVASWVITHKQSAGLITNGLDPLGLDGLAQPVLPDKGRGNLMRMLETLARVKVGQVSTTAQLIRQHRSRLSWGTTMIVITGQVSEELFDEFFQAQRSGIDIVVILCGESTNAQEVTRRARRYGIPVYSMWAEPDLELWQKSV
jgi:uncharacterized protein (DUF58 family)